LLQLLLSLSFFSFFLGCSGVFFSNFFIDRWFDKQFPLLSLSLYSLLLKKELLALRRFTSALVRICWTNGICLALFFSPDSTTLFFLLLLGWLDRFFIAQAAAQRSRLFF
jgi:hypothetical protein